MSKDPDDANDERAVMVLPPLPVARGSFALLVPGNETCPERPECRAQGHALGAKDIVTTLIDNVF